jgi:type IV secretory pathway VirB6-like protein
MKWSWAKFKSTMIVFFAVLALSASLTAANAQSVKPKPTITEKCTNFSELCKKMGENKPGLLTQINDYIKSIVDPSTKKLFEAFTGSATYQNSLYAAAVLMVLIYGISFLIGVTQASFGQITIRLIKLGILFTLVSPGGWAFFSDTAVKFFNQGTDDLIRGVISIGTGIPLAPGDSPFLQLDGIAAFIIQPDILVAVLGSVVAGGPYGFAMGGLIALAFAGVLGMLFEALKTYALSYVMRALLLGVAPIFLVFILFDRTKMLFTGWLNSLVNLSLQPILYFTFISFFLIMIMGAAANMFGFEYKGKDTECKAKDGKNIDLCWVEYKNFQGSDNKVSFWRFRVGNEPASTSPPDWRGDIACRLEGKKDCPEFPINIIDILSFLILIYVARRFASIVPRISTEISDAFVNIPTAGRLDMGTIGGENSLNQSAAKVPKR